MTQRSTGSAGTIALVAGEASGDSLGAGLIRAIKAIRSDIEFVGIGGPQMISAGLTSWYPQEWLAVRGYSEVIAALPRLLRVRRELANRLKANKPLAFIGIDAPDFNLGLEKKLKHAGVQTIHYVCPSLWAWREKRVLTLAASTDHVLCVFPFESGLLQKHGVTSTFVGHRSADVAVGRQGRAAAREELRLGIETPVFALLPGSRQSELEYHAELFIQVAQRIHAAIPAAQFLVPFASRPTRMFFEEQVYKLSAQSVPMNLMYGHADLALTAADVGLIASGTATLEAALAECPHAITYRISPSTYRMVMRKLRVPYVGLPNVLSGEFVVPELLQHHATVDNLSTTLLNLMRDGPLRETMSARLGALRGSLTQGADEVAARAVLRIVGR
jgi:lipid-A-disaccharide synthase